MLSGELSSAFEKIGPYIVEQRAIQEEVRRRASDFLSPGLLASPGEKVAEVDYLKANVFSILFIAIYGCLGFKDERRLFYGSANQCIRGIVTATDNILDNENKELLPLPLPPKANRFRSVMSALLYDRVLDSLCDDFGPAQKKDFQRELAMALYTIGEVEAEEEVGLKKIAPAEEIVRRVHSRRGGNLLKLAFVAPFVYEQNNRERIGTAADGVHSIGMALQMIDDVVDLAEDARGVKNNYLLSRLLSEKFGHGIALGGWKALAEVRPQLVAEAVDIAIKDALEGFRLLNTVGFGLDESGAMRFITTLFELRGGGELLGLLKS